MKIYRKYVFFFIHKLLFILLLSLLTCFYGICSKNSCRINDGVEYLQVFSVLDLDLKDINIVLPDSYINYDIPEISSVALHGGKVGTELNICPPVSLLENSAYEFCMTN